MLKTYYLSHLENSLKDNEKKLNIYNKPNMLNDKSLEIVFYNNKEYIFDPYTHSDYKTYNFNKDMGSALLEICTKSDELILVIEKYIKKIQDNDIGDNSSDLIFQMFRDLEKISKYIGIFANVEERKHYYEWEYFYNLLSDVKIEKENFIKNYEQICSLIDIDSAIETYNNNINFLENITKLDTFTIDYLNDIIKTISNYTEIINVYYKYKTNKISSFKKHYKRLFYTNLFNDYNFKEELVIPKIELRIKIDNKYLSNSDFMDYINSNNISPEEITNLLDKHNVISKKTYKLSCIEHLLNVSFKNIIEEDLTIRYCENCNKFFITKNRTDEKYCDNISPQAPDKTCKEYGKIKLTRENSKSKLYVKEYDATRVLLYKRIEKAKGKYEELKAIEKLQTYLKDFKEKEKKFLNNKINEEAFINWIISKKGKLQPRGRKKGAKK
jgi:hypothetical protein